MKDRRKKSTFIPVLEQLEDRWVPSAPAPAPSLSVISGAVLCEGAGVSGITITLKGTPTQGGSVDISTETNINGVFDFFQVEPGTYSLTRGTASLFTGPAARAGTLGGTVSGATISNIKVQIGQAAANYDFTFQSPRIIAVNLSDFLSSASSNIFVSMGQNVGAGNKSTDGSLQPSSADTFSSTASSSLSGTVTNAGKPLANVKIGLTGVDLTGKDVFQETTTNAAGSYTFALSQPGTYMLQVLQVPAGFHAGPATVPTGLDAISVVDNQIFNIVVPNGDKVAHAGYDFAEILGNAAPATLGTQSLTAPTLTVDTSAPTFATDFGSLVDPPPPGGEIITNPNGDKTATIDFTGTATASTVSDIIKVQLIEEGSATNPAPTTTDSSGNFVFTGVKLNSAINNFIVVASDSAGNFNTLSTFVVLNQAPKATSATAATTNVASGTTSQVLNLADGFTDPIAGNTIVQLNVTAGTYTTPVYLKLNSAATPQTVANFLEYVNTGGYNDVIFQRLISNFALQGGEDQLANTATGTTVLSGTTVASVTIADPGSGYVSTPPTVTFAPPASGTTATGTAIITGGHVTGVTITNPGTGYTSVPLVTFAAPPNKLNAITANSAINGEAGLEGKTAAQNVAGTLSMALSGSPNSATDQFFFNLNNNTSQLDAGNTANQGTAFTVFGQVLGGADMRTVNTLANIPTIKDESETNSDLSTLPLVNYKGTNFPTDATASNFEEITSASVVSQTDQLTYSVTKVTDPSNVLVGSTTGSPATVTVNPNGTVSLAFNSGVSGTVTITVLATNSAGASVSQAFTVKVA